MQMTEPNSQILIYQGPNGNIKIDVRLESETVWLTQAHMTVLFNKDKRTISEHIRNIFNEGELAENSVVRNFRTTALDGKGYDTNYYNLDVIISVGYAVSAGFKIKDTATGTLVISAETDNLKGLTIAKPVADQIPRLEDAA